MKTLLIALATGSLMLAACSSSKPAEEAAAPRVTVEEAMTQCQQASGENADRAVFDACMKDKGYQRTAESAASEPAASEPVAAPEAVAPEAAASEPAAKAAPAKKAAKKAKEAVVKPKQEEVVKYKAIIFTENMSKFKKIVFAVKTILNDTFEEVGRVRN